MDPIPTPAPSAPPVATQALAQDVVDDIVLAKQLVAAYRTGGSQAALALLPSTLAALEKDYRDVKAALPEIKAGYKTTEFWLLVGVSLGNGIYLVLTGKALPVDLNVVLGGVIGIYTVARALIKHQAATVPVVATTPAA